MNKVLSLFAICVLALLLSCSGDNASIPFSDENSNSSAVDTEANYHIYALDANTGMPLDSAVKLILLSTGDTLSVSENGTAVIEKLQTGIHKLLVEREGYASKIVDIEIGGELGGSVYIAREGSRTISLYPLTAGLNGHLFYQDENGKNLPLAGAAIRVVIIDNQATKKTYETTTNNAGYYSFENLPAVEGSYDLLAFRDGYEVMYLPTPLLIGGLAPNVGEITFTPTQDQSLFIVMDYKKTFSYEENSEPLVIKFSDKVNLAAVTAGTVSIDHAANMEWASDSVSLTITPAEKWVKNFSVTFNGLKSVKGMNLDGGSNFSITVKGKDISGEKVQNFAAPDSTEIRYSDNSVILTWQKLDGATGYRIYVKEESRGVEKDYETASCNSGTSYKIDTAVTCSFNNLILDKKYTFAIQALNQDFSTLLKDAPALTLWDRHAPGFAEGNQLIYEGCYFWNGECVGNDFKPVMEKADGDTTILFYDAFRGFPGSSLAPGIFSSDYDLPAKLIDPIPNDEISYGRIYFDMPMDTKAELEVVCTPETGSEELCEKLKIVDLEWDIDNSRNYISQNLGFKIITEKEKIVHPGEVNAVYSIVGLKGFNGEEFATKYPSSATKEYNTVNLRFTATIVDPCVASPFGEDLDGEACDASYQETWCGDSWVNYTSRSECSEFEIDVCDVFSSENPNPFTYSCEASYKTEWCRNLFNYDYTSECQNNNYSYCDLHSNYNPYNSNYLNMDFSSTCTQEELEAYCATQNGVPGAGQCDVLCEISNDDNPFDGSCVPEDGYAEEWCNVSYSNYNDYRSQCTGKVTGDLCEKWQGQGVDPFDAANSCDNSYKEDWCKESLVNYNSQNECAGLSIDVCDVFSSNSPNPFTYSCEDSYKTAWCGELSKYTSTNQCQTSAYSFCDLFSDYNPYQYNFINTCTQDELESYCNTAGGTFNNLDNSCEIACSGGDNPFTGLCTPPDGYAEEWCREYANYITETTECDNVVGYVLCTPEDGKYCFKGELKEYGSVKDDDDNEYKTVEIGTQTWMAENLNYDVEGSKCYSNLDSNCDIYGRLYDWATAMGFDAACNSNSVGGDDCDKTIETTHRGICPEGWHIPNANDWNALMSFIHGDNGLASFTSGASSYAGRYLKAASEWNSGGNGLDTYGFAALPGGNGYSDGSFSNAGYYGYWWSSSESDAYDAYGRDMYYSNEYASWSSYNKTYLRSVRCLQD